MARGGFEFGAFTDPNQVKMALELLTNIFEPKVSRKARQTREALESMAQQKAWQWPQETQQQYLQSIGYEPGTLRRLFRPSERQYEPLLFQEKPIVSTTGRPSKVYELPKSIPRPPMFERPSGEDVSSMKGFLSDVGIPQEEHPDILLSWQTSTKRPETFERTVRDAEKRADYVTKDPEEKSAIMRYQLTGDKTGIQDLIPPDVLEADQTIAQNRGKFPNVTDYDIAKKVIKNPKQFRKWVIFNEPLIKMEEEIQSREALTRERAEERKETSASRQKESNLTFLRREAEATETRAIAAYNRYVRDHTRMAQKAEEEGKRPPDVRDYEDWLLLEPEGKAYNRDLMRIKGRLYYMETGQIWRSPTGVSGGRGVRPPTMMKQRPTAPPPGGKEGMYEVGGENWKWTKQRGWYQ